MPYALFMVTLDGIVGHDEWPFTSMYTVYVFLIAVKFVRGNLSHH